MSDRTRAFQKTVVITGASSGIGRASALLLSTRGFRVFAGVRKSSDGERLREESKGAVHPVEIDVTKKQTIAAARDAIESMLDDEGLAGLVNNAGVGAAAPIEYLSEEMLRGQFDVNTFGQIAVIQAFLPLLRSARGRIVNIGSVGSRFVVPFGGALCSSKAAFTVLSDALRLELRPDGIHVCLVEPGAIHTPAVDKTLGDPEAAVAAMPPEGRARYGQVLRDFMRRGYERETKGSPPERVAEAVLHALTAKRPRLRYVVGAQAKGMVTLPRLLPDRVLDQVRLRVLGMSTKFG